MINTERAEEGAFKRPGEEHGADQDVLPYCNLSPLDSMFESLSQSQASHSESISEALRLRQIALQAVENGGVGTVEAALATRNARMQFYMAGLDKDVNISEWLSEPSFSKNHLPTRSDVPQLQRNLPFGTHLTPRSESREEWGIEPRASSKQNHRHVSSIHFSGQSLDSPSETYLLDSRSRPKSRSGLSRSPCLFLDIPYVAPRSRELTSPSPRPRSRVARSPVPGAESRPVSRSGLSDPLWRRQMVQIPSPMPCRISPALGAWST
eukprot:CAMPEP_0169267506 /NCGR_PEP_ID=MMETSP1016-20121227/47159_1 /TAXON_ID=342587 /ORGANISM="Karlodinium micrum, Strain CCMP2283" /LENGTH=265 /DNA_ID=CAMNT_0009351867 /DNA_START=105 /DNA_END=899 /DNA_ORIENTATION=+